jgi:hypothetical protein
VTLIALPIGEAIETTAGHAYGFDARIKTSHTKADLFALAASHGLTVASYGEAPPEGDYRRIVVLALATAPASIPWSVPWPASWVDGSTLLEATEETAPSPEAVAALTGHPTTPATVPTAPIAPSPAASGRVWPALGVAAGLLIVGDALSGEGVTARLWKKRRRR